MIPIVVQGRSKAGCPSFIPATLTTRTKGRFVINAGGVNITDLVYSWHADTKNGRINGAMAPKQYKTKHRFGEDV